MNELNKTVKDLDNIQADVTFYKDKFLNDLSTYLMSCTEVWVNDNLKRYVKVSLPIFEVNKNESQKETEN
ncbi:hypothetical protein [Lactobacillus gasseri]|uniref:Uncharacterized protein n=1 Tax=Lactobacillus gasseri TaxID=1596 RepID=A0AB33CGB6_LACGS|nr:hypothetical protein [Lactobacillus gasseri]ART99214.1 hypothetical protein CCE30_10120 [Lactobacillus gasseri]RBQ00707.1 hypothetical protein C3745_07245 [Lactobacillus gasseri]